MERPYRCLVKVRDRLKFQSGQMRVHLGINVAKTYLR